MSGREANMGDEGAKLDGMSVVSEIEDAQWKSWWGRAGARLKD